jgi:hypothetical protein
MGPHDPLGMALKALPALTGNLSRARILRTHFKKPLYLSPRPSTEPLTCQAQYLRHDRVDGEPG